VDLIAACPWYPATGSTVGLFMELVAVPRSEDFGGRAAPAARWHVDIAGRWRELPAEVVAELQLTVLPTFTSTGTLNVLALNAAVERAVARTAAARSLVTPHRSRETGPGAS
jgi:hypothetical protein